MKRFFYAVLAAAAVVGFIIAWHTARREERQPDQVRIRLLLEQGRRFVMTRNLRGAMSCISRNYRDSHGFSWESLRQAAARAMQSTQSYDVSMDAPEIKINGQDAIARTHVEVSTTLDGIPSPRVSMDLEIHLSKESGRHWLLFPVTHWRITAIEGFELAEIERI